LQGGQALPGPPWREALQGGQVLPGLSGGKSRWEDKPSLALPKWKDFRRGQALPGLSGGKSRWEDKPSLALPGSLFGDANALHGLPRGRVIVCGSIHQRWQCNTVGARSLAHNVARCRASPRVAAQCRDATRRWSSPRKAAMPRCAGRRGQGGRDDLAPTGGASLPATTFGAGIACASNKEEGRAIALPSPMLARREW
jgi:hypothetical protein